MVHGNVELLDHLGVLPVQSVSKSPHYNFPGQDITAIFMLDAKPLTVFLGWSNMKAFLTGSQIYGIPKPESDIDLVILTTKEVKKELIKQSDNKALPCQFGKLNIIITTNIIQYILWYLSKLRCMQDKPITRDKAIEIHKKTLIATKGRPLSR